MTTITVTLEDSKAEALRKVSEKYGMQPEQLVAASIDDLIGQPDADFDAAVRRVLAKNRDLYEQLA